MQKNLNVWLLLGAFAAYMWYKADETKKANAKNTSASEKAMAGMAGAQPVYRKGFAGNGALGLNLGG